MPGIRAPIEQTFFNTTLIVQTTPTPLNASIDLSSMIQAFTVCNPSFNSASVFIGDAGVSASSAGSIGTGIEILTSTSQTFEILQDRQMYELQDPAINMAEQILSSAGSGCQKVDPIYIPVIAWKPNNIFLICAVATVTVSVMFFRNVYI
jgi:hypothetical protein